LHAATVWGGMTQTAAMESERREAAKARKRMAQVGLNAASIERYLSEVLDVDWHVATLRSVSLGTLGVLHSVSLCIHVIGRAAAWARDKDPKHAVKQIDRLLSNENVSIWAFARAWVRFVVGPRPEVLVALDWTDFDADGHSTIAAYLITNHGRATPLLWQTVEKSELEGQRNAHEDRLLEMLAECMPDGVRVTVLADRGFGDQKRYEQLHRIGFDYVIRFREVITVTDEWGTSKPAAEWLPKSGRATKIKQAAVTQDIYIVPAVVVVRDRKMQESWCLATSRADLGAADVAKLYSRRFTIEESFRDAKDIHFGMGLKATHIKSAARRDRLLLLAALAHALLTLLGAAGERCGLDRKLKTNTSKKRQMSLYNQGAYWYMAIPNMREERLVLLMQAYAEVLREHDFLRDIFGVI
jgi:Transposase DDE domain